MDNTNISVKHFLNKKVKSTSYNNEIFYALHFQITLQGKTKRFKSRINNYFSIYRSNIEKLCENNQHILNNVYEGYFSEGQFTKIIADKFFPVYQLLEDEKHTIQKLLSLKNDAGAKTISIDNFDAEYDKNTAEITQILDDKIKSLYRVEIRELFMRSIDSEDHKDIFNITNYLIHYINWNNSFWHFYDSSLDLLPREIKRLENYLSNTLKTQIRAFLAYHAIVNVLKRFFEKREQGKMSTLSFLDWSMEIKEFVLKEFEKTFGEQMALQYVISLDHILTGEINV